MKKLSILALSMLSLAACGDDDPTYQTNRDRANQVTACVQQGGMPQFTSDQYGNVVEFLGCVMP